jgi:M6 family metalloprotease-like protein
MGDPQKTEKLLKVFLVRFDDIQNPASYTQAFFNDLLFSAGKTMTNPDGGAMAGSCFDYFFGMSDGYVRLVGEVVNWTTVHDKVTKAHHWHDGTTAAAYEAVLGLVVGGCLKQRNIRTLDDLKVGGRIPDGLVFIHTDFSGGGAQRSLRNVKEQIRLWNRLNDLWDTSWESWWDRIQLCSVPCCFWPGAPPLKPDGTIDSVPKITDLRWQPMSVLTHELGHLVLGYPDLYGEAYGPWLQFDIMGGPAYWNDFPHAISSYLQQRGGWFRSEAMPRRTHRELVLEPLESHSQAFRFPNGPRDYCEEFVVENRDLWDYWKPDPKKSLGNALLFYRADEQQRQIIPQIDTAANTAKPVRRITTIVRRNGTWGEVWGQIPGGTSVPDLIGSRDTMANSLNYLGERWWEFKAIKTLADGSIQFDAHFQPADLIRGYAKALWTNGDKQVLTPDFFHESKGHVMMVNYSLPIESGRRFDRVLSLHPQWKANGRLRGRYSLQIPAEGARLYLAVALSEEATGSDGYTFRVISHAGAVEKVLAQTVITPDRNIRTVVVDAEDLRSPGPADITLEIEAGATATRDWAYLLEAYLVPMSEILYDFIDNAGSASWHSNSGQVTFGVSGNPSGEASREADAILQNGRIYGGDVLFTHPAWRDDGFIEGIFTMNLPNTPSVFRAEVGFDENRKVVDNGARISLSFTPNGSQEIQLLQGALLERRHADGEQGLQNNPVSAIAVPLPALLKGKAGKFKFRVDADGSAGQDWVWWTMARLTRW